MKKLLCPAVALIVLSLRVPISFAQGHEIAYGDGRKIADLAGKVITESSGLACGRANKDIFWTHNDSGGNRSWLIRLSTVCHSAGYAIFRNLSNTLRVNGATGSRRQDCAGAKGRLHGILCRSRRKKSMPIYEYQCRKCGHGFEHLARTLSEPVPKCPKCGAAKPEKQLSVFSAAMGSSTGSAPCAGGACPSGGGCPSGGCPYVG